MKVALISFLVLSFASKCEAQAIDVNFGTVSISSYKDTVFTYSPPFGTIPGRSGADVTVQLFNSPDSAFSWWGQPSAFRIYSTQPVPFHVRFAPHVPGNYPAPYCQLLLEITTPYQSFSGVCYLEGVAVRTSDVAKGNEHSSPIQLFPNPASSKTAIRYPAHDGATSTVTVRDVLGRTIREWKLASSPSGSIPFDVSNLPAGQYSVEMISGQSCRSAKLNVIR